MARYQPLAALLFSLTLTLLTSSAWGQGTASGVITLTVVTESGTPIAQALVTFRAEGERLERGQCVTDEAGTCTLQVLNAPTDASGLIRGYLYLGDGQRPVLWPGGDLAIEITTSDSGRLRPPADFIDSARGTPTPTVTGTPVTPLAPDFPLSPSPRETSPARGTPTATATEQPLAPSVASPVTEAPLASQLLGYVGLLLIGSALLVALLLWRQRSSRQTRQKGEPS